MGANKVTNGIYSVGVLNPNMRIFDVVMKTEYGTSYNSYLVKGSEKTALIETAHHDFFDAYIENVKSVTDLSKIEYLIMNHNEPDHSGGIEKLLTLIPNITIVVSQAGAIYLKNIVNCDNLNLLIVKDGDTLSLGDKTLSFISAPFLHWPDSIFTYVKEEKALFSCDFLGAHYCEPNVIDTKILPKYKSAYEQAVQNYYNAIFGPFKPYVLKGLEKIKDLSIDFACVSHGPILSKEGVLSQVIEKYRVWSTPTIRENKLIPIFYCSAYHNTTRIAYAISKGISEILPNANVACYDLNEHSMDEMAGLVNSCDAFLLGSPTINKDAVPPVWNLLSHIDAVNFAKRPCALFGSYGWSGEAFANLRGRLTGLKAKISDDDFKVVFVPTKQDLEKATDFGREFAKSIV